MGLLRDATGGLPQEAAAARVPEARSWLVLFGRCAAAVRTTSAVAVGIRDSTLDSRFRRAQHAAVLCKGCA